jgi:hypothetical protein
LSPFDFEAFRATLPSYGALPAWLGGWPHYTADPKRPGWVVLKQAWRDQHLITIPAADLPNWPRYQGLTPVSGVTMHRGIAPLLVATWAEVNRRGLAVRLRTFDGAFAPRHAGNDPSRLLSVHTFGLALDFDARWNGYGVPASQADIDREFVRCMEECGWAWGGRWLGSRADAMHFEALQPHAGVNTKLEPLHPTWPPSFPAAPERLETWRVVAMGNPPQVITMDVPEGSDLVFRVSRERRTVWLRPDAPPE